MNLVKITKLKGNEKEDLSKKRLLKGINIIGSNDVLIFFLFY